MIVVHLLYSNNKTQSVTSSTQEKMKILEGDLLQLAATGEFDVIVHGCNCFCTMGAGIAKGIKTLFPEAYQADLATKAGDREKLGTITWVKIVRDDTEFIVVNAYTQYHYAGPGRLCDYDAIRSCFAKIKTLFPGCRIGLPKIGAGLAGGDWQTISNIIQTELQEEDTTLVLYKA